MPQLQVSASPTKEDTCYNGGRAVWAGISHTNGDAQARDCNAQYRGNPAGVVQYFSLSTYFFQGNGVVLFIEYLFLLKKQFFWGEVQRYLLSPRKHRPIPTPACVSRVGIETQRAGRRAWFQRRAGIKHGIVYISYAYLVASRVFRDDQPMLSMQEA